MSQIQKWIRSQEFSYLQPYFYDHDYALRCELGIGENDQLYSKNAYVRALQIYQILFPNQIADAVFFNHWYCDGEPEQNFPEFFYSCPHEIIPNLPVYPWDEEYIQHMHRDRIICYSDRKNFPYPNIIKALLHEIGHEESFVSFCNECILSVYDDRGCDVVFADPKKFREFYPLLEPYFLDYDRTLMQERLDKIL